MSNTILPHHASQGISPWPRGLARTVDVTLLAGAALTLAVTGLAALPTHTAALTALVPALRPAAVWLPAEAAAFGFGALMEALHPVLPGRAPFLTRSLVFVGQNWHMDDSAAREKLGFVASDDWREVVADTVEERRVGDFAWPELAQA